MATLKTYLTGSLSYDSSWGVWAKRVDGKFELESDARFGQFIFENGGMDGDFDLVGDNVSLVDARDNYCGTDEDCENFYEKWTERFVKKLNQLNNDNTMKFDEGTSFFIAPWSGWEEQFNSWEEAIVQASKYIKEDFEQLRTVHGYKKPEHLIDTRSLTPC